MLDIKYKKGLKCSEIKKGKNMLQTIRLPLSIDGESHEDYEKRCIIPYPIVIPDPSFLKTAIGFRMGVAHMELRIRIIDGKVTQVFGLFEDGSVKIPEECEQYIEGIQSIFDEFTEKNGCSFENDTVKVENYDNDVWHKDCQETFLKYRR